MMDSSNDYWTWIAIGVPFVLCIATAIVLALYAKNPNS